MVRPIDDAGRAADPFGTAAQRAGAAPAADARAREALLDHLYDLAVDPSRFEGLVDWWDREVRPSWTDDASGADFGGVDAGLAAHLDRAAALLDRVDPGSGDPADDPFAALIEPHAARAAVVLDEGLRPRAATAAARSLFGLPPGPVPAIPLRLPDPEDHARLHRALRARLANGAAPAGLHRLRRPEGGRPVILHLRRRRLPDGAPVLLAVAAEFVWQPGATAALRAAFDLTEAEADVARLLAEGIGPKDIARRRGASPETVRKQLRAVFAKTHSRSQVELTRAALSVADLALFTEARARTADLPAATARLKPLPFLRVQVPGGRGVDYLRLGDPRGRPVLHLPQDYGFIRLPASAEAEAARRGLRLITPVYAGYGGSDPAPPGADYAAVTVSDLLCVLAAEGVARCPILSSMTTWHAVQLIHAAPGRFTALVQAPATWPLETRAEFERMDKWHRVINGAARYTPALLPFLVKAGFHLARRVGKRDFLHAVYSASAGDMAAIADPEAFEAIVTGSEVALGPGRSAHRPFAQQVVARVAEPWGPQLRALEHRLPVIAFQGLDDPCCPPATLAEQRLRYPWMRIEAQPNAGELLLFTHWPAVFEALDPFA